MCLISVAIHLFMKRLVLLECLDSLASSWQHSENVESDLAVVSRYITCQFRHTTHGLAEGSALANGDLVTNLDTESWRDVCGEVLVALLVTGVLWDEVKVLAADDQSTVHLGRNDGTGEDTATDGDETSEWALLVCNITQVSLSDSQYPSPISRCFLHHVCFFHQIASSSIEGITYRCRSPQWRSLGS